ncbi:MAG: ATP-binding protein [Bacteroidota bacterium]|nr:ATP-binding protein [Bacteroidota bacterium]
MKFKAIVNRDLVNLTNCEHEPIHIPGSIQPHGFLLGLKIDDLTIDFCSGNSFDFTRQRHEQLLGKSFEVVFGEAETKSLKNYISVNDHSYRAPHEIELAGKSFTCTIQTNSNLYIVELEPVSTANLLIADIYQQTKQFTSYIQKAHTLQMLCQSIADETRAITGYDRVMIYRFDEDYNGEIFAESKIESIEPFLGLHYPHTDIPVQARELYIKNLLRLIVDVNYAPVPIYTIDDAPNKNLDLGLSSLRSVSPIHIQYLNNMGVGATLTISLMHENRLWGLIACHHYSPKYIRSNTRIAAQLQGHFLTSQITVRQASEEYEVAKKVNKALDQLLSYVFSSNSLSFEKIVQQPELLTVTNATSVIIAIDDTIYSQGRVLPADEIRKLINWLQTYSSPTGFSTSNLSKLYPDGNKFCNSISGIIFHSLGSGPNNCIIWCRAEALQEVHWAGNPEKAIIKDEKGLSPRKSFELWKEVKKCESNQWQKPEVIAAANFANAMQKHVHMMFLSKEELKYRKLSEKLKKANAELENLNWIGSHDLKEPLRKIQVFASRILDEDQEGTSGIILNSVKKMSESANRMQKLIADVLSYSRLSHVEDKFKPVSFSDLVKSVIDELSFEINEKKAVIEYTDLPTVKGIAFLLQQLLVNLIRNALKFSKADTNPYITIDYSEADAVPEEVQFTDTFYKIVVRDNGIGFDNQHKESIFKVFTRLHDNSEYSGSGVGLALCRKIMQSHYGYITAESKAGIGTAISLYFPQ